MGWNGYLGWITLTSIVSVWVGQEFGLGGKGPYNTWLSHYFPIPSPIQVLSPLHRQAWWSFVTWETIQMCLANDLWLFIRLRSSFAKVWRLFRDLRKTANMMHFFANVFRVFLQMCFCFLQICSDFFCRCVPIFFLKMCLFAFQICSDFFLQMCWVFASVFSGFRPT